MTKYVAYTPRLTKPAASDKSWLKYGNPWVNGNDQAMEITYDWKYTYGSCLPNCVGYMWGRVYEISKQYNTELPTTTKLSVGNAKSAWGHNADLWARGQQPRLGAVICWTNSGAGHVGIVEKIEYNDDKSIKYITVGEGAYAQYVFTLNKMYPGDNYTYWGKYPLQGFIYPPYCDLFSSDGKPKEDRLEKETILLVSDKIKKYVQRYITNYTPEDPGFDVTEPPPPPTPGDADGTKLVVGNKIKVIGKGNTSKTGGGQEVNKLDAEFVLKSFHPGFPYPYRLGPADGRGVGYWAESGIKKL